MQALNILFSLLMFFSVGSTSEMPREPIMPVDPPPIPAGSLITPDSIPIPTEEAGKLSNITTAITAQCLTEKGAKMYGAFWCSHCENQKKMFGDNFRYITYIECDPRGDNGDPEACEKAGVKSYPTWIFADGKQLVGTHEIETLAETAGC